MFYNLPVLRQIYILSSSSAIDKRPVDANKCVYIINQVLSAFNEHQMLTVSRISVYQHNSKEIIYNLSYYVY